MLQASILKGMEAGDAEAAQAMRDLVETVTVRRDPSKVGGVEVEIAGRLNALLGEQAFANGVRGSWGKLVAEARYRQSPHPVPYRLTARA